MAHANNVYLGYEEHAVPERSFNLLNYTINKIGGLPDWPPLENIQFSSKCPLCGLHRLLIVQCYAPLDLSSYHRTLYVFACVSPNCWTQSESWTCIRSQFLDDSYNLSSCTGASVAIPTESNLTWCSEADDWDDNDNGDAVNGNIMNIDNVRQANNSIHRSSDEDDESSSLDVDTVEQALGDLHVYDARNANMSPVQGAVGPADVPAAAAELEGGDEPGLVMVDTPTTPHHDLQALLNQTSELPMEFRSRLTAGALQFIPKYIYVEQETRTSGDRALEDRVDELLSRYKRENGDVAMGGVEMDCAAGGGGAGGEEETYEEARPLHGDKLFHNFLARLRSNPGQILRYSRGAPPLLGAPLSSAGSPSAAPPTLCQRCGSRTVCELQLLPKFTTALNVHGAQKQLSHLQFLSVLVFTCSESCWSEGDRIVAESVVFQPEIF